MTEADRRTETREEAVVDVRQKVCILKDYLQKRNTRAQAALRLGVTEKTMSLLKKRYLEGGSKALQHKGIGRRAVNRIEDTVAQQIVTRYETTFQGFNFTHFYEQLVDRGILREIVNQADIPLPSARTVERMLRRHGIVSPQAKRTPNKQPHPRRPRRTHAGELVQVDASLHDWFSLGPTAKVTLHLFIDNATSTLTAGIFTLTESLRGYMLTLKGTIEQYGIPEALYSDRRSILEHRHGNVAANERVKFQRVCKDLGIAIITTSIPQAKGRVERSFRTHQDRLVSELRLHGITTIEEANHYLEGYIRRHNARYAILAHETKTRFKTPDDTTDLSRLLAVSTLRTVLSGNVVSYRSKQYYPVDEHTGQRVILPEGIQIEVKETLDERLFICDKDTWYKAVFFADGRFTTHKPGPRHPWR